MSSAPAHPTHRLAIVGAALLFSTGGAAIKLTAFDAWQVAGFRSLLAAAALLLLMPDWRGFWRPRALLVGTAYAATMILYVSANKLTTAANAIFLQATAPLYLLLLGPLLLREAVHLRDLALAALLACGMALFFAGTDPPFRTAPDPALGNGIACISGVAWALTLLGLRWLERGADASSSGRAVGSGSAVIAGNVLAAAFCLPLALPVSGAAALDWSVVIYLGLFQIGLAYLLMTRGLRRVPAVEASLLLLLEPVANALIAWAVHGERPGALSLAGCLLIVSATGIRVLQRGRGGPTGPSSGRAIPVQDRAAENALR